MKNKRILFACDNVCVSQVKEMASKLKITDAEVIRKAISAYYYEVKKNDVK